MGKSLWQISVIINWALYQCIRHWAKIVVLKKIQLFIKSVFWVMFFEEGTLRYLVIKKGKEGELESNYI